jgi:hypothetical protein
MEYGSKTTVSWKANVNGTVLEMAGVVCRVAVSVTVYGDDVVWRAVAVGAPWRRML